MAMARSASVAAAIVAAAGASAQQRGVTATEVTFGMPTDLSGAAATYGVSSSNGVKMRFDEVNEAGGIDGRKLKVIVEDQAYQVPKAVQACNKLINRDKVFAFVGAARHADEQRLLQGPVRGRRAQPVPAVGGALDVRAVREAEVLRRRVLRRPDPLGHQLLRQEQGQEDRLRDVPGHRLRQGDPRGRQGADQEARHQARRDDGAQADRPGLHRADHQVARGQVRADRDGHDRARFDRALHDGAQGRLE